LSLEQHFRFKKQIWKNRWPSWRSAKNGLMQKNHFQFFNSFSKIQSKRLLKAEKFIEGKWFFLFCFSKGDQPDFSKKGHIMLQIIRWCNLRKFSYRGESFILQKRIWKISYRADGLQDIEKGLKIVKIVRKLVEKTQKFK
jgi:hypothetical protein